MKRIFSYLSILIAIVCITTACSIREDLSECYSELILRFRYTLNKQNQNLFGSQVSNAKVYVFDSNNKYFGTYNSPENMSNSDLMKISLPKGNYHVVVLGHTHNTYKVGAINNTTHNIDKGLVPGETDINDFRLELLTQAGLDSYLYPTSVPDNIFMGTVYSAESKPRNDQVTDVDLISLTKNIIVNVIDTGEPFTKVSGYEYDDNITNRNGRYDKTVSTDNTHGIVKYKPIEYSISGDTLTMKHKVMRLMMDDTPTLEIFDTENNNLLFTENIINLITATPSYNTQEDIDREDTFIFNIRIYKNVLVNITVNNWVIYEIEPEL